MRKGDVEIILTKEGCKDIKVTCSAKIKMHPVAAFAAIQYGLPPMQVKPVDWKGGGLGLPIIWNYICLLLILFGKCGTGNYCPSGNIRHQH